jgi:hypothetical protein
MCTYTCRHRPEKIASNDRVNICTAYSQLRAITERVNPARSHRAYSTANTKFAKPTLRLLPFKPVPGVFLACFGHLFYHLLGSFVTATFFNIHNHSSSTKFNQKMPKF